MIINYNGTENFTIKSKNKTVKIGQEISLGDLKITTPGEYESGGVQVEMIDGIIEVLSEKMSIAWIKKGKFLKDEEIERINGISILLIGVGGGNFTETKIAIDVINQIEPSIVIPMYEQNLDSFLKEEGVSGPGQDQLKITFNELPQEERKVVILNPST
ncbi:MAG: Zn-dependent hydrolase of the beta-lactamase fold-like protein [Candidatus Berkelbacteria bacterium]|nr:Zn-dependent hydrolase of the beta-lactamase fold-like protein [Candidatus Berkelbacteria bacterium]